MLYIKNVYKTFNPGTVNEKKALIDINLHLNPGDFITVIGGNGAGKSTLLNMIAGVYPIDNGSIQLKNVNLTNMYEHQRAKYIGRVFQDPLKGTAAGMEIIENLALANRRGERRGFAWGVKKEEKEAYRGLLGELDLGLESRLNVKAGLLSGGQRQALTLLMATLKKPDLLLLDEHTAALDPKTAEKVLQITENVVQKDSLTTIMITHNMRHAIAMGNRLIMMMDGQIIYDISGEEKQNLQVKDLLERFESSRGGEFANDRMLLS